MTDQHKVIFQLEDGHWSGMGSESLWASNLTEKTFQLDNIPFFIKGVSQEDIISVRVRSHGLHYSHVVKSLGNSTYRLLFPSAEDFHAFPTKHWKKFDSLGCSFEGFEPLKLIAINVDKKSDAHAVYKILEVGENSGLWDFEEGNHPS